MLFALRLAKAGYGKPDEILDMNLETVLAAIDYESFLVDYQDAFMAMREDEK
jgi:hypothetical protein